MRVRVHWNRTRKTYSILYQGRVIDHQPLVRLTDCKFVILPGAQRYARQHKRRNVHALVEGIWDGKNDDITLDMKGTPVMYHYERTDTFVTLPDQKPIHSATIVEMTTTSKPNEGKRPYMVAYPEHH